MQLKKFKKINLTLLLLFLFGTTSSYSEINSKSWSEQCNEDKSTCLIAIKNEIKLKDKDEQQTLATAYIQIGSTKERKMNLVDKEDQTYKLSEEDKNIPLLFVNLPLNADLRKKPLVQVDGKNLGNLNYLHCNNSLGCKTSVVINNEVIDLLKKGKNMTIFIGIFGSNQNLKIEFPLKGFSKAYNKLI
jgi:invasion protein IalB